MEDFLEILKFTIPSIIVFLTIFLVMRAYLRNTLRQEQMKLQYDYKKETLPLRIQAYERLMLFCERIQLDQLIFRIRDSKMNVKDLQNSLMIAIQQEYEHNLSQQVYISDTLWKIIELAKNEALNAIVQIADGFDKTENALPFSNALLANQGNSRAALAKAKEALREEIKMLF